MIQDNIMEINDYKAFLKHKGKIRGSTFSSTLSTVNDDLVKEFGNYLFKAKAILINIDITEDISLFVINDLMANLFDKSNKDVEFVFSTKIDNKLKKDEITIEILLSGLED